MNMTSFHAKQIDNGKIALIPKDHMITVSTDIQTIENNNISTNCRSGIGDAQSIRWVQSMRTHLIGKQHLALLVHFIIQGLLKWNKRKKKSNKKNIGVEFFVNLRVLYPKFRKGLMILTWNKFSLTVITKEKSVGMSARNTKQLKNVKIGSRQEWVSWKNFVSQVFWKRIKRKVCITNLHVLMLTHLMFIVTLNTS